MREDEVPGWQVNHAFAADVARDLRRTPKQLQSKYLYDALGSTLFEAICRLPWYRITRAEERLLAEHGRRIVSRLPLSQDRRVSIVELGVGSGEKLATLAERLPPSVACEIHLIDISTAALDATSARLSALPGVSIARHEGTYEQGLAALAGVDGRTRKLVLFLGSNIGNFDGRAAADLVAAMRRALAPGDLLLLGADLVKPEADLLLAYDDPLGVTAAFDKNLLVRINRELGGTFDLQAFDHRAVWNAAEQRVEMHLVSTKVQHVSIPGARVEIDFAAGEAIWTESSYKYTERSIAALGTAARLDVAEQWVDDEARFALTLFEAV